MRKKKTIILILFSLIFGLAACSNGNKSKVQSVSNGDQYPKVGSFSYIDQDGNSYSQTDLDNKVWLANFIFANCETVCPPMTAHMAKVQKLLKDNGVKAQIVSFSVDPKRDTPQKLKAFGMKFDANFSNWHFLTGYHQKDIETFARKSFKTAVSADPTSDQFIHGTSFFLINQKGQVIKRYDGVQNVPFKKIVNDTRDLNKKER
ncbi:protein SCO1/2 [Bacillus sp. OV194]|nr:protein SCO1/2 [Bacillus sp. OV194]